MSLQPERIGEVPVETARIAALAFPHGTVATRLRDASADLYRDEDFAALYPKRGQPCSATIRMVLIVDQDGDGRADLGWGVVLP